MNNQLVVQAKEIQTKLFSFLSRCLPSWIIWIVATWAICSCRYRRQGQGHVGADEERPVGQALGIRLAGAQLLSASCFFPLLVEWRKCTEWLFFHWHLQQCDRSWINEVKLRCEICLITWILANRRHGLFSLGHLMSLVGFGQGSRGQCTKEGNVLHPGLIEAGVVVSFSINWEGFFSCRLWNT